MSTRADYQKLAPESMKALLALDRSLAESTLGPTLIDLVKIRASQLNGCLFCLDLHSKEARMRGERELRLYHLPLWRESTLFSERERAALAWTERLTQTSGPQGPHGITDANYDALTPVFSEKEIVDLTYVVSSINAWNRIGIAFTPTPGSLDKIKGVDKAGLH